MKTVVKVEKFGDSVENIYIIEWKVAVGDSVTEGDTLLVADTNKVEVDIPAPSSGVITEIFAKVDDEVAVGEPLCEIESS
mgnify:CR=1 FL=1|tara:strand:- start:236 stop:475 length:240 start_codon:yes stop_codon:yes gene_type:complete